MPVYLMVGMTVGLIGIYNSMYVGILVGTIATIGDNTVCITHSKHDMYKRV